MPSVRISRANNSGCYFLTITVVDWIHILDKYNHWQILADSLNYCVEQKRILIGGYVFMPNHIHLVIQSTNTSAFVRDFKHFTSTKIKNSLETNDSGKIKMFEKNSKFHLWKPTNMPILIESYEALTQKVNYIHQNPVRKNLVEVDEEWIYSSANPESPIKVSRAIW